MSVDTIPIPRFNMSDTNIEKSIDYGFRQVGREGIVQKTVL